MIRLQTPVEIPENGFKIGFGDGILLMGSCFSDNIGSIMKDMGFNVMVNPFGTLYNPVSVCNSIRRLDSAVPFSEDDCVQMGAGSQLFCSFSHHTAAARSTKEEFVNDANASLSEASEFFKKASTVIITLGTAWTFRVNATGEIVSNCLKHDAKEFTRECLSMKMCEVLLNALVEKYLWCIDTVIRKNRPLMRAARLEYDDVYQQLALRLIRAVAGFDPQKGTLQQHIFAQLRMELLNCKRPYRLHGMTGMPADSCGNVISLDAYRMRAAA